MLRLPPERKAVWPGLNCLRTGPQRQTFSCPRSTVYALPAPKGALRREELPRALGQNKRRLDATPVRYACLSLIKMNHEPRPTPRRRFFNDFNVGGRRERVAREGAREGGARGWRERVRERVAREGGARGWRERVAREGAREGGGDRRRTKQVREEPAMRNMGNTMRIRARRFVFLPSRRPLADPLFYVFWGSPLIIRLYSRVEVDRGGREGAREVGPYSRHLSRPLSTSRAPSF